MVSKFRDFFFMKKNIGIQGIKGSFHHIVANNYFEENINLIEYLSFEELILNLFNDILITLGPTKCTKYLFGIFNANDVNELKDLIEEDIYWKKGIWINYDIYPWIQAF